MEVIELVIKIPDGIYQHYKKVWQKRRGSIPESNIAFGTPLPKGHGRLGDLDELIQTMKKRNDDNGGEPLNAVDRGYDLAYQHMVKEAEECVIIEADTIESEDKE